MKNWQRNSISNLWPEMNDKFGKCYGYRVYISYITYPFIPTQTLVIESLHHSTYFLTYPFYIVFHY